MRRVTSLWESLAQPGTSLTAAIHGRMRSIELAQFRANSMLGDHLQSLQGRSVLVATYDQLHTAIALVELDGIARRIVLCTPDLTNAQLAQVATMAQADAIVLENGAAIEPPPGPMRCWMTPQPVVRTALVPLKRDATVETEWVLLTSGTTGAPKLVSHTLDSLSGTLPQQRADGAPVVWSTFYDIRRYGGLQIFLRSIVAGTDLVLSCADEPVDEFLARAAATGVTHISGTPSHWRRALMSGVARRIHPRYVRLSGEIADQAVLDNLRATYPDARIAHAFASTEAGVAFDVDDGLAGFPADFIGSAKAGVEMKVEDGTLRIRSQRNATHYLGNGTEPLAGHDGFVDTGDLVELVNGRYYFRGRRGGIINVGGLKVHPEEVESVLNADPRVRMSLVRARRNPITGAVVVADIVLAGAESASAGDGAAEQVKNDLLGRCRLLLPAHKVPTMLRIVPSLEMTAAGKLVRPNA
ncbi:MAG: AMP-binding protein [Steroidobacterales bacterium]